MEQRKKRVGPTERLSLAEAKKVYPMQLTERDMDLLELLASGLQGLTTEQIKRLYFPGNWSTCTKRSQKLFQNRFIWRYKIDLHALGFEEGPQETLLHTLDEQGAMVLARKFQLPVETFWQPGDRTIREKGLRHLTLNNDVRIAIKLATETLGYTVEWETDKSIRQKPEEQKWVVDFVPSYGAEVETSEIVPDDYLVIETPKSSYLCVLEIDTGSEIRQPQKRPRGKDTSLATKIRRYISFLHKEKRSDPSLFEKLTDQQQKGIRVFFVTTGGEKAVESLLETIRNNGGKNTYWVGRYDLARREDLVLTRPIWRKAGDDEPAFYPWIGRSKVEELQFRLKQCGVATPEIEARVTQITNLAKAQLLDGVGEWSERKMGMSLAQAVALRADELAEAILGRLDRNINRTKYFNSRGAI